MLRINTRKLCSIDSHDLMRDSMARCSKPSFFGGLLRTKRLKYRNHRTITLEIDFLCFLLETKDVWFIPAVLGEIDACENGANRERG